MGNISPQAESSSVNNYPARPNMSQSSLPNVSKNINAGTQRPNNSSKWKFYMLIVLVVILAGVGFIFTKDIFFKPPLSAKMTLSKSTIKPIGLLSKNTRIEAFEKNNTAIKITYKNNTSKTLRDVNIRLNEVKSAGDKNLIIFKGVNIIYLEEINPSTVMLKVQDLPPKSTNYVLFHIVAQHKGKAQLRATVISDEFKARTNTISFSAE